MQRLTRRAALRAVAAGVNFAAFVWLLTRGAWLTAAVVGVAGVALWLQTSAWARDPAVRIRDAAVSIAADTLSLLLAVGDWLRDHAAR